MRVQSYFIILVFIPQIAFSQSSDMITVKTSNNRMLISYYPGAAIECQTVYGNHINGRVLAVKNDSVFVKEHLIYGPDQRGSSTVDSVRTYVISFHYRDIDRLFFEKRKPVGFFRKASVIFIGGLFYTFSSLLFLMSLTNGNGSWETLGVNISLALGAAGTGYLVLRLHKYNISKGKKYIIEYVSMN